MTGNTESVIEVSHLLKNYGSFNAVYDVSFTVRRGEIFALLGPNGAGKTTVVEILELLKHPTKGFISILGSTVVTGVGVGNEFLGNPFPEVNLDFRRIKEKIGVLPQSFAAFDLLTVYENLDYFARMYPGHADLDRLIQELGLEDKRSALFRDLSGGLKQRVGIALALVNDPEIIFLDEPSSGLDPKARRDLWEAIKALKARGKTVVLTTHYLDEAYHLADRICILHKGTVIAEGTPDDLINAYGGGNILVIRGCDAPTKAALAGEFPGSVTDGSDMLIRLPEEDSIEIVWKAAALLKSGPYSCRELYVKKSTLDDVFLSLTGKQLDTGPQDIESIDDKVFQAIVGKIAGSG
ncbi:ABC transporter ATP-binding protein [Methanocella sp. MCL-LM]|uniref:ABC transporter ATP-binding protein n=1 Tax=Methanocella sp. MCL-LM TaxID=3412035 RepID=UPI003C75C1D7